jgi:hypothetical protein
MQVVRRADYEIVWRAARLAKEVLEPRAVGEEPRVREVAVEDADRIGEVVARD